MKIINKGSIHINKKAKSLEKRERGSRRRQQKTKFKGFQNYNFIKFQTDFNSTNEIIASTFEKGDIFTNCTINALRKNSCDNSIGWIKVVLKLFSTPNFHLQTSLYILFIFTLNQ